MFEQTNCSLKEILLNTFMAESELAIDYYIEGDREQGMYHEGKVDLLKEMYEALEEKNTVVNLAKKLISLLEE